MSNLKKYIEQVRKYQKQHPDISENELIRYIYLDLGKRFSFNENFLPFGSSKKKQNLYKYHSQNLVDLEECMETNIVICKSVSYILEYILKAIGVNIKTVISPSDIRKCPHVYNIITLKDGKTYIVDLNKNKWIEKMVI